MANAERTEKPTAKRRDEARKKGQVARSPELGSLFILGAAFAYLAAMGPTMFGHLESAMRDTFQSMAAPDLAHGGLNHALNLLVQTLLVVSLPFVLAVAGGGLLASVAQVRPKLVLQNLKPDFKRVSPKSGARRIFSPHSLVELVKSIAKLSIVSGVVFLTVWPRRNDLASMGALQPSQEAGLHRRARARPRLARPRSARRDRDRRRRLVAPQPREVAEDEQGGDQAGAQAAGHVARAAGPHPQQGSWHGPRAHARERQEGRRRS